MKRSTLTRRRASVTGPDPAVTAALFAIAGGPVLALAAERDAGGALVDLAITDANTAALEALAMDPSVIPQAFGETLRAGGVGLFELLGRCPEGESVEVTVELHAGGRCSPLALLVVPCGGGFLASFDPASEPGPTEDLGLLAGRLGHEFNNLLQDVRASTDAMRLAPPSAPASRADLDAINLAVARMAAITRQLQTFTRQHVRQPVELELNAWIGALAWLLRGLVGETARLDLDLRRAELRIRIDPVQLELALFNLVENAREAVARRAAAGVVRVATEAVWGDPRDPVALEPGRYARISVTDDGEGLDDGEAIRIIDADVNASDALRGKGLGLANVRRVVADAGGAVDVTSRRGHGTRFDVFLPLVDGARRSLSPPPSTAPRGERREEVRVLLVDDEPTVLRGAARLLERIGYRVLVATGAAEALEALARETPVDVVITDFAMPGSTGADLLHVVRAEWPEIATIMMSGHTGDPAARADLTNSETVFLAKPFSVDDLQRAVERVLASRAFRRAPG